MQRLGAALAAALVVLTLAALMAAGAARADDQEVISSAGPMANIYLNNDLGCQVSMLNDVADSAFFGDTDPGGCGTFMQINAVDGGVDYNTAQLFGPPVSQGYAGGDGITVDFTPVSQSLTGAGTAASPYTVTTTAAVCSPASGVGESAGPCDPGNVDLAELTETDTYVVGADEYLTALAITNQYGAPISGTLYHSADCYLEQDDGYGAVGGPAADAPECTLTPGDSPASRIMSFIPTSGPTGASYGYFEGGYPGFWDDVTAAGDLYPDSIGATADVDNGMGLSWRYSVPAGGTTTIGYSTLVSPAPPLVSTDAPTVLGAQRAQVSATVNPDGAATTVSFEYGLDSKYGLTTAADPYVDQTPGQSVGSGTSPVTVTATLTGLVPNALYHVRAVASSASGTTLGDDRTFTTATLPPPPPPTIGQNANFIPVSGNVYVQLPGATNATRRAGTAGAHAVAGAHVIPLTLARQLPVGTVVNARRGRLRLTTATSKKRKHAKTSTQSGLFSGGQFEVGQSKGSNFHGLTTLTLLDNGTFGSPSYSECSSTGKARGHAIAVAAKKKPVSKKVLQTLKANEHGNYKTKGKYSAATVLGTQFSVSDRCGGTVTHVYHGIVVVTVYRTGKRHTLHTGQSYYAKAP